MPNGLLDMFGIDPITNRNNRRQDETRERMIAAELARQRVANEGAVAVENARNKGNVDTTNAQTEGQKKLKEIDAALEYAKRTNIHPAVVNDLERQKDAIQAQLDANTNRSRADRERSQQELDDANKGSSLRGISPQNPIQPPRIGIGPLSQAGFGQMIGATNNPILGAMAQMKIAASPQQLQADPRMLEAQRATEIMKARAFADTSARANSITTGPGSITSFPTIDGMQQQGGAIEQDTLTPDQFGMLHSQKTQNFPAFVPPEVWKNMPQTPPVGAAGLNVNNASRGMSPLSQNQAADLDMQAAPPVNPMALAAQGQTPQQNTMLSTLLAAIRAEINKKGTNAAPLFPGRTGGY